MQKCTKAHKSDKKFCDDFSHFFENFVMTFSCLFEKLALTFSCLFEKFVATFLQIFENFLNPKAMLFLLCFLCNTKFVSHSTKVLLPFEGEVDVKLILSKSHQKAKLSFTEYDL